MCFASRVSPFADAQGRSPGGRGLSFGRLFNAQGQLVASVAQEGLIRHSSNADEGAAAPPKPRARL